MSPASLLDRGWRLLCTAVAFTSFGIGGVLLGVVVFPVLTLLERDRERLRRRSQRVVHHAFRLFIGFMHRSGLLDYRITNAQALREPGQLIVANHPTLIDVVFLIALVPEADCVVRAGLRDNPFTRFPVRAAGYIGNDGSSGVIDRCVASLAAGRSLIVFPEGTRSVPGRPLRFQRGAAWIALRSGAPLRPVRIRCEPVTLTKGEPWFRIPPRRPRWTIEVGAAINPRSFAADGVPEPLAARRLTQHLVRLLDPASVGDAAGGQSQTTASDRGRDERRPQGMSAR